ncbi:hypothetical protein [Waltera sp.]|uniref:hypothetical protein n=1 Tax=Waltera sp. TaxID=2815806 RepID=UPI0039A01A3A
MKKTTKRLVLAVLLFLLLLLTGYFILAFYYREGFSVNTWINGVYCTGKTVEEVNSELFVAYRGSEYCHRGQRGDRVYNLSCGSRLSGRLQ